MRWSEAATANVCTVSCHVVRGGGHMARPRGWPVGAESCPQLTAHKQKDIVSHTPQRNEFCHQPGSLAEMGLQAWLTPGFQPDEASADNTAKPRRVPDPQQVWNNTRAHLSHGIWGHLLGSNRKLIQIAKCLAHSRPAVNTVEYISDFVFKGFPGVRGYI